MTPRRLTVTEPPATTSGPGVTEVMFSLENFIEDCRSALKVDRSHRLVQEVVQQAVSDPASIMKSIGEPSRGQLQKLYHAPDLTILNVVWAPTMMIMPHDHQMWAVIGLYTGREDNIFWRRSIQPSKVEAAGARSLSAGDVDVIGDSIIHSVSNPIPRFTASLHVYGGDFFAAERSEWDPETLLEERFNPERAMMRYEQANAFVDFTRRRSELDAILESSEKTPRLSPTV